MDFEFCAFYKNMRKWFIITLIELDLKFRQIAKFAVFLCVKTVSIDNAGSCK